jgi:hypothetical protein
VSENTIFNIFHKDLALEKKSARWVHKLLSENQKPDKFWICPDFSTAVDCQPSHAGLHCYLG